MVLPKFTFITVSVLLLSVAMYAQPAKYTSTINAAGGTNTIASNIYEWSVGEMAIVNTGVAANIIVTQGVLQPAQGSGSVSDRSALTDQVSVYPVPTKSSVFLQYNFPVSGSMYYELIDMTGKLISSDQQEVAEGSGKTTINMEQLANAAYMLQVKFITRDGNISSKSFQLKKIN